MIRVGFSSEISGYKDGVALVESVLLLGGEMPPTHYNTRKLHWHLRAVQPWSNRSVFLTYFH